MMWWRPLPPQQNFAKLSTSANLTLLRKSGLGARACSPNKLSDKIMHLHVALFNHLPKTEFLCQISVFLLNNFTWLFCKKSFFKNKKLVRIEITLWRIWSKFWESEIKFAIFTNILKKILLRSFFKHNWLASKMLSWTLFSFGSYKTVRKGCLSKQELWLKYGVFLFQRLKFSPGGNLIILNNNSKLQNQTVFSEIF